MKEFPEEALDHVYLIRFWDRPLLTSLYAKWGGRNIRRRLLLWGRRRWINKGRNWSLIYLYVFECKLHNLLFFLSFICDWGGRIHCLWGRTRKNLRLASEFNLRFASDSNSFFFCCLSRRRWTARISGRCDKRAVWIAACKTSTRNRAGASQL